MVKDKEEDEDEEKDRRRPSILTSDLAKKGFVLTEAVLMKAMEELGRWQEKEAARRDQLRQRWMPILKWLADEKRFDDLGAVMEVLVRLIEFGGVATPLQLATLNDVVFSYVQRDKDKDKDKKREI